MRSKALGLLSLVLRLIAAAVFLYAGWQKAAAPEQFADSIAAYQLLPPQLISLVALALPPLELIIGGLLLIGWQRRLAAFSALILSGVFLAALASAIARGLTIDCGCFGAGSPGKGDLWMALSRDTLLVAALLFVYLREICTTGVRTGSAPVSQGILPVSDEAQK